MKGSSHVAQQFRNRLVAPQVVVPENEQRVRSVVVKREDYSGGESGADVVVGTTSGWILLMYQSVAPSNWKRGSESRCSDWRWLGVSSISGVVGRKGDDVS